MKSPARSLWIGLLALALATPWGYAKEESKADRLDKAYQEGVKDSEVISGIFKLRRKDGKLYAELAKKDFEKPFLLFGQISRGMGQGGALGGTMLNWDGGWLLEFQLAEERIHLVRKNTRFTSKSGTPIDRARKSSISDSILASFDPVGKSKSGNWLIGMDSFFFSDPFGLGRDIGYSLSSGPYSVIGSFSHWTKLKGFPKNFELEAEVTYGGSGVDGLGTVPDPTKVTLGLHYSLVAKPKAGFKSRKADDRVGHFMQATRNFSKEDVEGQFERVIDRWRLEKADPKAKVSTAKKPIIFYLEKSIPYAYRPFVRAGIEEWKKAFEKAGFLDAIEVRQQRDKEDWDPEDIRYNTIRWITSPFTFAIGPSHTDPRTGEILDADVLIDASWIRFWQYEVEGFGVAPNSLSKARLERLQRRQKSRPAEPISRCKVNHRKQSQLSRFGQQFALGGLAWMASKEGEKATEKGDEGELPLWYIGAALKDLVMHEVGHTLGLRHNFKASSIASLKELHDRSRSKDMALVGSVMDYVGVNLAPEGMTQGDYFNGTIGPYDEWAIEYAYKDANAKELEEIAKRGNEPELAYATDEDAYYFGLDPHVATYDLSSEPLAWAESQILRVKKILPKILERAVAEGESYVKARRLVGILLWEYSNAGETFARHIAGVHVHRNHRGDPNQKEIFQPVSRKTQEEALAKIVKYIFADETYALPPEVLKRMAPSHWWHWGEQPFGSRLDFPYHERVLGIQLSTLFELFYFHLPRVSDVAKMVDDPKEALDAFEILEILRAGAFSELDSGPGKSHSPQKPYISSLRRNLQRSFVEEMIFLHDEPGWFSHEVGLAAKDVLRTLDAKIGKLKLSKAVDRTSSAHLRDLKIRIERVLDPRRQVDY